MKIQGVAFMAGLFISVGWFPASAYASPQCVSTAGGVYACTPDPVLHPDAVCNDGSPAEFFYRPGTGSGASTWLIWLQGGAGYCYDTPSCTQKATNPQYSRLITSTGVKSVKVEGLLSSDRATNPLLYNANNVYVHYCSSDFWSGSYRAAAPFNPSDPTTWNFEGRTNALAAVASLSEMAVGFASATEVLFGGDSAGGMGAVFLANDVLPLLPPAAQAALIVDAGFTIDTGAYDASAPAPYVSAAAPTSFEQFWSTGLALWNGHGDSVCDAQAVTPLDHVRCATTSSILNAGYVTLPVFVAQTQLDTPRIQMLLCPDQYGNCNVSRQPGSPQGQFASYFGQQMATMLQSAGGPPYSVFAPDQFMHVVLANDATFTASYDFPTGALTARSALYGWLGQMSGPAQANLAARPGVARAAAH